MRVTVTPHAWNESHVHWFLSGVKLEIADNVVVENENANSNVGSDINSLQCRVSNKLQWV
jgi:hypothetical protein